MIFTELDLSVWPRGQMFYYFSKMAPTGYSLTVNLDISSLRKLLHEKQIKFFPVYLWLVTKDLNQQIEFKVAYQEDKLGYYDVLTPLYASFHQDDQTFSLMWTEYNEDFSIFYQEYQKNQDIFGTNHGVLAQTPPPPNAYTVSCIPWITFDHFAVHSYQNQSYFFPFIKSGKFYEQNSIIYMPFSMTCHHATTDGYHVHKFLTSLSNDIRHFNDFI